MDQIRMNLHLTCKSSPINFTINKKSHVTSYDANVDLIT
uniref:Uncharacterized protein n=1 Tax=Arundo donax TaxID=35708 RepID=A0A0A9H6D2_ARUDO